MQWASDSLTGQENKSPRISRSLSAGSLDSALVNCKGWEQYSRYANYVWLIKYFKKPKNDSFPVFWQPCLTDLSCLLSFFFFFSLNTCTILSQNKKDWKGRLDSLDFPPICPISATDL